MRYTVFVLLISALFSCAVSYYPVGLSSISYPNSERGEELSLEYRYHILEYGGNKRYAKKASKKGIKMIALEIENISGTDIHVSRDLIFRIGNDQIDPIPADVVYREIRQSSLLYLLYAPILLYVNDAGPLPVGLPVSAYNMIKSHQSNKSLKADLEKNDVNMMTIPQGSSVQGYLMYKDDAIGRLIVEVR